MISSSDGREYHKMVWMTLKEPRTAGPLRSRAAGFCFVSHLWYVPIILMQPATETENWKLYYAFYSAVVNLTLVFVPNIRILLLFV